MTATDRFLSAIQDGDIGSRSSDLFAPGVTFDAVVPNWRFGLEGGDAVASQLAGWYASPMRFEELRCSLLPSGAVVELTLTWEEAGMPYAARQVHVLDLDPVSDRITSLRTWCGGRWSAALLAEMESAHAA